MKHKKLVYLFLVLTISFVLFLPILNLSLGMNQQKITLKSFSKERLFSTDNVESILNYVVYKSLHFSLNQAQVVVGKEGFLFLGNGYVSIIDKTTGKYYYTSEQIERWTTKLKALQEWYVKRGIKFMMVVAPNKHTVYSEMLPKSIVYNEGKTITDDIIVSARKKGIAIFNLKDTLQSKKAEKQLYFSTDTHWNHYGASIGYLATMKYLNNTYHTNYKIPNYTLKEIESKGGGDLSGLFKISPFLSDHIEHDSEILFEEKNKMCYGKIDNKNYKLSKCSAKKKNTFTQYVTNSHAANQEKLLYMCDSFGLKNADFYYATFSTVFRVHLGYLNGATLANFVKEHKPDVVIYQIVERNLGSDVTVATLPEM